MELSNCGALVGPVAPVVFAGAVVPLLVTVAPPLAAPVALMEPDAPIAPADPLASADIGAVAAASVDEPVAAESAAVVVVVVVVSAAVSSFLLQAAAVRAIATKATAGFRKDMEDLFNGV